ncbi:MULTISPECIES: hypothetical protein [unclassified Agrococcus]|uniref:hypothetical protein n=1 Tax=unclassified Agrococcus TaxID=2615065 RepID=UPI0036125370
MVDERQPRIVEGVRLERGARRGLPDDVALHDLAAGPVARRMGADRLVVAVLAPSDAPPVAIAARRRRDGEGVDAVLQPTIAKGARGDDVPWHCVLRLPEPVDAAAALAVRIRGLGDDVEVVAQPAG